MAWIFSVIVTGDVLNQNESNVITKEEKYVNLSLLKYREVKSLG